MFTVGRVLMVCFMAFILGVVDNSCSVANAATPVMSDEALARRAEVLKSRLSDKDIATEVVIQIIESTPEKKSCIVEINEKRYLKVETPRSLKYVDLETTRIVFSKLKKR